MAFKALADMVFGNKIRFKKQKQKQKKSLLRRNIPYYDFLVLQTSGKGVIH